MPRNISHRLGSIGHLSLALSAAKVGEAMNTINENMSVAEVVKRCPNARRIFDQHGLKGCGGENGPSESLSFFATVHQVNLDELVREINDELRNPDPYFVSLDLSTARHPQILLATHLNGKPLTVEHGAPLRLVAPVKLGLKNVKAITRISYAGDEPADYWAKRGYSRYEEFESLSGPT